MKIMHVWNTAMSPATVAIAQRKLGHEAETFDILSTNPLFNFYQPKDDPHIHYHGPELEKLAIAIYDHVPLFDVIHLNEPLIMGIIPYLKDKYPLKPIVVTYRGCFVNRKKGFFWREYAMINDMVDLITVSGKELMKYVPKGVKFIPNTIDYNHCTRHQEYTKGVGFWVNNVWCHDQSEAEEEVIKHTSKHNIALDVQIRNKTHYPYREYPRYIERFEYYFEYLVGADGKRRHDLGRSALQMLALGGKVINWGKTYKKLPKEHEPERVAKQWIKLYEKLI